MAGRAARVPAVQVEVSLALARLDPAATPAHRRERKVFVRRELKLLLARRYLVECRHVCFHFFSLESEVWSLESRPLELRLQPPDFRLQTPLRISADEHQTLALVESEH